MELSAKKDGADLEIALVGRLDTQTAPQLEAELGQNLEGVERFVLDLTGIDYVSSAGLRAILAAQKTMNRNGGTMLLRGVCEDVMEVFDMTGFSDILTFE